MKKPKSKQDMIAFFDHYLTKRKLPTSEDMKKKCIVKGAARISQEIAAQQRINNGVDRNNLRMGTFDGKGTQMLIGDMAFWMVERHLNSTIKAKVTLTEREEVLWYHYQKKAQEMANEETN